MSLLLLKINLFGWDFHRTNSFNPRLNPVIKCSLTSNNIWLVDLGFLGSRKIGILVQYYLEQDMISQILNILCNIYIYIYRVVQIKVYDRVCSLNQLINQFLCCILFLSTYIYRQFFFFKHVFKINRKKVTVIWILCKRCVW